MADIGAKIRNGTLDDGQSLVEIYARKQVFEGHHDLLPDIYARGVAAFNTAINTDVPRAFADRQPVVAVLEQLMNNLGDLYVEDTRRKFDRVSVEGGGEALSEAATVTANVQRMSTEPSDQRDRSIEMLNLVPEKQKEEEDEQDTKKPGVAVGARKKRKQPTQGDRGKVVKKRKNKKTSTNTPQDMAQATRRAVEAKKLSSSPHPRSSVSTDSLLPNIVVLPRKKRPAPDVAVQPPPRKSLIVKLKVPKASSLLRQERLAPDVAVQPPPRKSLIVKLKVPKASSVLRQERPAPEAAVQQPPRKSLIVKLKVPKASSILRKASMTTSSPVKKKRRAPLKKIKSEAYVVSESDEAGGAETQETTQAQVQMQEGAKGSKTRKTKTRSAPSRRCGGKAGGLGTKRTRSSRQEVASDPVAASSTIDVLPRAALRGGQAHVPDRIRSSQAPSPAPAAATVEVPVVAVLDVQPASPAPTSTLNLDLDINSNSIPNNHTNDKPKTYKIPPFPALSRKASAPFLKGATIALENIQEDFVRPCSSSTSTAPLDALSSPAQAQPQPQPQVQLQAQAHVLPARKATRQHAKAQGAVEKVLGVISALEENTPVVHDWERKMVLRGREWVFGVVREMCGGGGGDVKDGDEDGKGGQDEIRDGDGEGVEIVEGMQEVSGAMTGDVDWEGDGNGDGDGDKIGDMAGDAVVETAGEVDVEGVLGRLMQWVQGHTKGG